MIKAVVFDVDGVLLNSFEANLKFYQDLMTRVNYKSPTKKIFEKIFHLPMMEVIKVLTKSSSKTEIKKIWLIGKDNTKISYPNELVSSPDGYDKVIKALAKKYILAIVTNRIRGGVFRVPQLASLKNYFKAMVYYEDTKHHKPNPEPLLLSAKRLSIHPKNIVYIGDSETDIQAAKAAKMKSILYPKKNVQKADASTSSFKEIPKLIDFLSSQKELREV